MTDIVTKAVRSRMMASIRGKDTKPEMIVRQFLHGKGFRYRLHVRSLPGCPDIVLAKYRMVIFVHGCFWHRHEGCRFATVPDQNGQKWEKKFDENVRRDVRNIDGLLEAGWRVLVIWECGLRAAESSAVLARVPELIINDRGPPTPSLTIGDGPLELFLPRLSRVAKREMRLT